MSKKDPQLPEQPAELKEDDLQQAQGGIGLLLPAVQKVREAAARTTNLDTTGIKQLTGDGSV